MSTLRIVLRKHSLVAGLLLMVAFTWPIDLANAGMLPFDVPLGIAVFQGWGFAFASLLMTGFTMGRGAVVALLKRFLVWRVAWYWYLVTLLLLPSIFLASVLLRAMFTQTPVDFSQVIALQIFGNRAFLPLLVLPWFLYEAVANGEEIGWRGYILPRLQTSQNALVASLILGLLWGLWHLPKFLGGHPNAEKSLPWYMLYTVAVAVLYTWLYNSTRGSLLLVTLFHASANTAGMFLPISFAMPGGITVNLLVVLVVVVAVVVTVLAGPERLTRSVEEQVPDIRPLWTGRGV